MTPNILTEIAVNKNVIVNHYHLSESSIRRDLLRQYVNNIRSLSTLSFYLHLACLQNVRNEMRKLGDKIMETNCI